MCCSKQRQKFMFFAGEEVGFKLGAPAAGGDDNREFKKLECNFFVL